MSTAYILRAYLFDGTLVHEQRFFVLPIRIGRNALNDFRIPHALVSNFHAVVEPAGNQLCVRDSGSKNGVFVRPAKHEDLRRIEPHTLVDLSPVGLEFFVGPQVCVSVQSVLHDAPPAREAAAGDGIVLGNPQMLMAPGFNQPIEPGGADASGQAPVFSPFVAAGAGPNHAQSAFARRGLGYAGPHGNDAGGDESDAIPATQHFGSMALEKVAFQGLHELAASLVPDQNLNTAGDVARFITKLHDAMEVFCRCFIPLREGYAQFVSSLDLRRAADLRSRNRSRGYVAVEAARDPEALAKGLLDFTERSLDAHKAIENIYADLMIHQLALLDGVMQGVRALLDELSPESIEQGCMQHRFGSPFSNRYKELWQAYSERFEDLAEERQAFSRIFGPEFTEAYREYRQKKQSGEIS